MSARIGIAVIVVAVTLAGCATGPRIRKLRTGMDQAQVTAIMGDPDGVKKEGEYESFQYVNRLISGWAWDKADYGVVFYQGKVTQYGAGTVRQDQSHGTLLVVPLR
jgi:outer membrane protein assembly factor BamE (lipoprotein component of BamABCDE complex)